MDGIYFGTGDAALKYDRDSLSKALDEGLKCLTESERYVLFLTYYEDLYPLEVCDVLSISSGQYDYLLMNARAKMRRFTAIFDDLEAWEDMDGKC